MQTSWLKSFCYFHDDDDGDYKSRNESSIEIAVVVLFRLCKLRTGEQEMLLTIEVKSKNLVRLADSGM